jgi:predicted DNA-binding transcriptional regulator AlpA
MKNRPKKRRHTRRSSVRTIARSNLALEPLDGNKWYDDKYVAVRYRVHPITIWAWSRKGIFPRPVKIGPNITRWSGAVIAAFERMRAQAAR